MLLLLAEAADATAADVAVNTDVSTDADATAMTLDSWELGSYMNSKF